MTDLITTGALSNIIEVNKTERFIDKNIVAQVIKTKQSNAQNSLEIHLSDREHIFVGIIKVVDPSLVPLYSIIKLNDFSINFPKRFLSILEFQLLDKSSTEIITCGKNLSYHPVYKKDSPAQQQQQQQQPQQQQQQQYNQPQFGNNNQQQQQKSFKPNITSTPNKTNNGNNPIPKPSQQQTFSNNNYSSNRTSAQPPSDIDVLNSQVTDICHISESNSKPCIKAVVMSKMPVKEWQKNGNCGKLFSVVLQDSTGEIKATCFTSSTSEFNGFDHFDQMLQVKKSFKIQGFSVKAKNESFNKTNHSCELTFNSSTSIVPIEDSVEVNYNFEPISNFQNYTQAGSFHDVIGVIVEPPSKQDIKAKSGSELTKASFTIQDKSGSTIEAIFWNKNADIEAGVGDVLTIKSGKLNFFSNNKNLSCSFCEINNQSISEVVELRAAYSNGTLGSGVSLSKGNPSNNFDIINFPLFALKTLPESSPLFKFKDTNQTRQTQYRVVGHFSRIPTYIHIGENIDTEKKYLDYFYLGCSVCKKSDAAEVHQGQNPCGNGTFNRNYKMQFRFSDESESISVDLMGYTCQKLLNNTPVEELSKLDQVAVNKLFAEVLSKFYEVTIQISIYNKPDGSSVRRYNVTTINEVSDETYSTIIDDSFNQCRLFNKD